MEYMLLADGSLLLHETLIDVDQIHYALAANGSVAYYWHNIQFGWSCVTPDSKREPTHGIKPEDVPNIIKLALMLE